MADSPRYLLVWDRMGDYHVARWRALQAQVGAENVFATDLAAADNLYGWQTAWAEDPQYALLSSKPAAQTAIWERFSAFAHLLQEKRIAHVALAGYGRPEYILMAFYARLTGRRVVLFAESWYPAAQAWKDRIKGRFVSLLAHRFLVSGVRAARHFHLNLGIAAERIAMGYSVVDNAHFASAKGKVHKEKVLLCVARFAPEKNLPRLIEAFSRSGLVEQGWTLKLVGGGPQREELEALAAKQPGVVLHNWLSYPELPALYASARAFVLPSLFEPWGLVVNEALAAGLPTALSHEVGALPDLLGEETPYRFSALDADGMANVLTALANAPAPDSIRINAFTPDTWASTLRQLSEQPLP